MGLSETIAGSTNWPVAAVVPQPSDADLAAIAALATTPTGRALLTSVRDTAANLAAANLVYPAGALVAQSDAPFTYALADGVTAWLDLRKYYPGSGQPPVQAVKSDANITVNGSTGVWQDTDPSGTVNARTYDIVIPGVAAGQRVEASMEGVIVSAAGALLFDFWTVKAGVAVSQFGTSAFGSTGLCALTNTAVLWQGGWITSPVLAAGDIENGSVRLRVRHVGATGVSRVISGTGGAQWRLRGRGPIG